MEALAAANGQSHYSRTAVGVLGGTQLKFMGENTFQLVQVVDVLMLNCQTVILIKLRASCGWKTEP